MVTHTSKTKAPVRRSATPQKLEKGSLDILKNGQIEMVGQSKYRVSSMSSDTYHEVSYKEGLWRCDCRYYTTGHTQCKHIYATRARVIVQETVRQEIKTVVNMPKRQCPKCKSPESNETDSYNSRSGIRPVYRCAKCKYRFVYRPGFMYRQFSDDMITDVLIDAAAGQPPGRIVERLDKMGIKVSERTIQRWIKEYSELIERLTKTLQYNLGDIWSLDEVYIKNYPTNSGV